MDDAYFARIGIRAPAVPDLDGLRAVVAAHVRAIPFENLDPFTGRPVDLAPAAVTAKLVDAGRGGYCFEQNALLQRVLDALGYRTTGLTARVVLGQPADAPAPPRTHMLLRVDLPEGPHLADVGFGGLTPTGVLTLVPGVEQATPHEPYRLLGDSGVHLLQVLVVGEWRSLYRFDLGPAERSDYEIGNWYVCTHPRSGFVTDLAGARVVDGGRIALRGRTLSVHRLGQPSGIRELQSPAAVREALERDLLIDTSGLPDLDDHLARLF